MNITLRPSGQCKYRQFSIQQFYVLPTQCVCFVWIWEQIAIISLYSINWLICITETECLLRGTDWIFIYNSTFCPHSVFMCFVWLWEQTAIISLYSINWLVFIAETEGVYCAVRAEFIYIFLFLYNSGLHQSLKQWFPKRAPQVLRDPRPVNLVQAVLVSRSFCVARYKPNTNTLLHITVLLWHGALYDRNAKVIPSQLLGGAYTTFCASEKDWMKQKLCDGVKKIARIFLNSTRVEILILATPR